jgi:hypothetical protein
MARPPTGGGIRTREPGNIKIIYFPVGGSYLPRDRERRPCSSSLRDSASLAFRSSIGCSLPLSSLRLPSSLVRGGRDRWNMRLAIHAHRRPSRTRQRVWPSAPASSGRGEAQKHRSGKGDRDQAGAKQDKAGNGHSEETVRCEFFTHGPPPQVRAPARRGRHVPPPSQKESSPDSRFRPGLVISCNTRSSGFHRGIAASTAPVRRGHPERGSKISRLRLDDCR